MANTYKFTIGEFQCTVIHDGGAVMPASNFFGSTPAEVLTPALSEAGINDGMLNISLNILLIQHGEQRILVDTGLGVGVREGAGLLLAAFEVLGFTPEQITAVLITHGHRDHIGGLVDGTGSEIFPNARLLMNRAELEFWLAQDEVPAQLTALRDRIETFNGTVEILPGLLAIPAPGHSVGHTAVLLTSNGAGLLHIVDAMHSPFQVLHPEISPAPDNAPDQAVNTRRALRQQAAAEGYTVLGYHFPFPGLGRVTTEGESWRWSAL
jgi:glyoxylase-like metal-dependent hydrolase (beta-lactamase superfamily II)